jgi:hypothetical protein
MRAAQVAPDGVVYFSSNSRRFKIDEVALSDYTMRHHTTREIPAIQISIRDGFGTPKWRPLPYQRPYLHIVK